MMMEHPILEIDGSRGEGGGQVLRTSLSLSALTGRPFRLVHIRAGRPKPGLRPQHLTAVRAAAKICKARLIGDQIDSPTLEFYPQTPPQAGEYLFDVNDQANSRSAGSITLVLQTVLWPLLFAEGSSRLVLRGGTHVPYSPSFHYLEQITRPAYARFGLELNLSLQKWGWMSRGGGEMTADIRPVSQLTPAVFEPLPWDKVQGQAIVTNLPGHIPHRMARRADNLLAEANLKHQIEALRLSNGAEGAVLFLWLPQAGFSGLGSKGVAAQDIAAEVVKSLLHFVQTGRAVDLHLADQLLLPMTLATGSSSFSTELLTLHTLTNAHLLQQWFPAVHIAIEGSQDNPGTVTVTSPGWPNLL